MTLLDTHIWVRWLQEAPALPAACQRYLHARLNDGFGVSVISCWEVAKLIQIGRLELPLPALEWIEVALLRPSIRLVELTPAIVVEATQLPKPFHRDPADEPLVATARILKVPLLTLDRKILAYPHVGLANTSPKNSGPPNGA